MPNVLSPRDLVSRPDNMDETVLSSYSHFRAAYVHRKPVVVGSTILFNSVQIQILKP